MFLFFLAGFSEAADGFQQSENQHFNSEIMICQIALHVFLQGTRCSADLTFQTIVTKRLKISDVQTLHDHFYIYDHVVYSVYFFPFICYLISKFVSYSPSGNKKLSWMVESRIRGAKFCGDVSEAGGPITGRFSKRKVLIKVHHQRKKSHEKLQSKS